MNSFIRQPVAFNAITIASLAVFIFLTAFSGGERDNAHARAEVMLEMMVAEGGAVDEASLASAKEALVNRNQAAGNIYLMVVVAVISSFAANYIGRGRHFNNTARIRELEAQLGAKS